MDFRPRISGVVEALSGVYGVKDGQFYLQSGAKKEIYNSPTAVSPCWPGVEAADSSDPCVAVEEPRCLDQSSDAFAQLLTVEIGEFEAGFAGVVVEDGLER